MNDSVFFATFDPRYINAPDACSLCIAQPPAFNYEYCVEQTDGKRHYIKGFWLYRMCGWSSKETGRQRGRGMGSGGSRIASG